MSVLCVPKRRARANTCFTRLASPARLTSMAARSSAIARNAKLAEALSHRPTTFSRLGAQQVFGGVAIERNGNRLYLNLLLLAVGAALLVLFGWRWNAPIVAWLWPILFIRFFRNQHR
jgi:hypothetical protein